MSAPEQRVVTSNDLERLRVLLDTTGSGAAEELDSELQRAVVVTPAEVPPDVVTMNSRVLYVDEDSHQTREVTLTYPKDAAMEHGRVSVLAPIGAALLGLAVGQEVVRPVPGGGRKRLRILAVPYQPQAAGQVH